jgi:16S rRNA processing protein RimM
LADDKPVPLAAIAGAHGVTGEVRLKLFAESVDSLTRHKRFAVDGRTLVLKRVKQAGKNLVARFEGVGDRTAAEGLRGLLLTVPRDALPEPEDGEVYVADLIGRAVRTTGGDPLGTVVAVENFGAGDILEIELAGGARAMVPFSAEAVPSVDPDIIVDPDFLPG